MMKAILLFCCFFVGGIVMAQAVKLEGVVMDGITKMGIEGAIIVNLQTGASVLSSESGYFRLNKNTSNTDTLQISAFDFETQIWTVQDLQKAFGNILLQARDIQLSEVVVSATPNIHNKIISKIDIKLRGINNAQEVLRMVPGLFIGQHAGGGKAEQIFLRGFDIDHGTDIAISVDGIPVNMVSHAHGQGYADLHFLIPELIDRVDFKKGTYYPEKGNFTTTGYVDFKTTDILQGNSIKLEGGMFHTFRAVGLFNLLSGQAKERGQSLYIASEYLHTKGYFDHPQNFSRLNLFTKYHGALNNNNSLNASLSFFNSGWNASGQIPDRSVASGDIGFFGAVDPNEGGETGRANAQVQLLTTLPNKSILKNQLYYTDYAFELYSNFTFFKTDPVNGDQIKQKENRKLFGYNGSYSKTAFLDNIVVTTTIGTNIRMDRTTDSELSRTIKRHTTSENVMLGNIKEANGAAYIHETFKISEHFLAVTGLRYDFFTNAYKDKLQNNNAVKVQSSIISPKVNFQYSVNSKTQFYISGGKGFHSNDTRVAVQKGGREVLPSVWGADLGAVLKPAKNLFINTALWYLWLEQEFIYVGDEGVVEPSGRSRRVGLDVSARYQPARWLFMDVDLAFSKPRSLASPKGEDYLPLAPRFTSTGGVTIKTQPGINGSLRYRYMGDRPANEDFSSTAKGYFINDAQVQYATRKYELGISIQNGLNVRWKETQFETESQLLGEATPVSEIHFTPGTPFFLKASFTYLF